MKEVPWEREASSRSRPALIYRAIFCQLDGHLESQGAMLLEHFNTAQKVDELLEQGVDVIKPPPFDFLDDLLDPDDVGDTPMSGMTMA